MNLELEALIKAYDAAIQSQGKDSERLEAIYESLLANALERHPNVSLAALGEHASNCKFMSFRVFRVFRGLSCRI